MSVVYRVQQKFVNNYINISETNKSCKHKYNAKRACPVDIYLFKVCNENKKTLE